MRFEVLLSTAEQAACVPALLPQNAACYLDAQLALTTGLFALADSCRKETDAPLYLALPRMTRQEPGFPYMQDLETWAGEAPHAGFRGMLVRNFEQLAFLTETGYGGEVVLDYSVYVWNGAAFALLREQCASLAGFTLSPEMSLAQWKHLLRAYEGDDRVCVPVYGFLPLMVSAGCVLENDPAASCSGARGEAKVCTTSLTDRTARRMQVTCHCRYCYNVIWNAHRLSLHEAIGELAALTDADNVRLRMDFTLESVREAAAVYRAFTAPAAGGEDVPLPYTEYTTGRLKKGVE